MKMKINKKLLRVAVIIISAAVLLEIVGFNYESFMSVASKPESVSFTASEGCYTEDGKTFVNPEFENNDTENPPYFEIKNINKEVKYLYLDMLPVYESEPNEGCFDVYLIDEGNCEYYECGTVRFHPSYEKTKYIRLHSYGKIKAIKLVANTDYYKGMNARITINDIVINAKVPVFFSIIRVLLISLFLAVLYMFRPSSEIYKEDAFTQRKRYRYLRLAFMAANIFIFVFLLANNLTLANPSNETYRQYNLLVESMMQGRVNIEVPHGELMKEVLNPYDLHERRAVLSQHGLLTEREPWHDIAYFGGKFYVYFGVVPALIFFLPVYALTKTHMIMSAAVFIVCCLIVIGAYALTETIIKLYFPKTSYGVCLFASVMLANCTGTLLYIMLPIIYYMVILISVMFVFFGLNFWLKAKMKLDSGGSNKKACAMIAAGSLCMALVAGCRPQFLLASFLIIPIFWDVAIKNKKLVIKGNISKYLCVIIPYAVVAAGLMYYNYIRFGSPFDFGANYNLTTNNLTMRGIDFGRLPTGLFMYFIQLPIITLKYPFVSCVNYPTDYVGMIYVEPIYGGALFTCPFILFILVTYRIRGLLKKKKLYILLLVLITISIITACFDVELGGIILRYMNDFVYLLFIGALIVLFALYEKYGHTKKLVYIMLILGFLTLATHFFIGLDKTSFLPGSTEGYFRIYNMFI